MFETLYEESGKALLMLVIGLALFLRLAMKHPHASGGVARGLFSLFSRK